MLASLVCKFVQTGYLSSINRVNDFPLTSLVGEGKPRSKVYGCGRKEGEKQCTQGSKDWKEHSATFCNTMWLEIFAEYNFHKFRWLFSHIKKFCEFQYVRRLPKNSKGCRIFLNNLRRCFDHIEINLGSFNS